MAASSAMSSMSRLGLAEWLSLKPTDIHHIIKNKQKEKTTPQRYLFQSKTTSASSDESSSGCESSDDNDWSDQEDFAATARQRLTHKSPRSLPCAGAAASSSRPRELRSQRRSEASQGLRDSLFDLGFDDDVPSAGKPLAGRSADPFGSSTFAFDSEFLKTPAFSVASRQDHGSATPTPARDWWGNRHMVNAGSQGSSYPSSAGFGSTSSVSSILSKGGLNKEGKNRDARVCFEYLGSAGGALKSKDGRSFDGHMDSAFETGFDLSGRPLCRAGSWNADPFDVDFNLGFDASSDGDFEKSSAASQRASRPSQRAPKPSQQPAAKLSAWVSERSPADPSTDRSVQPVLPSYARPSGLPRRQFLIASGGHRPLEASA